MKKKTWLQFLRLSYFFFGSVELLYIHVFAFYIISYLKYYINFNFFIYLYNFDIFVYLYHIYIILYFNYFFILYIYYIFNIIKSKNYINEDDNSMLKQDGSFSCRIHMIYSQKGKGRRKETFSDPSSLRWLWQLTTKIL